MCTSISGLEISLDHSPFNAAQMDHGELDRSESSLPRLLRHLHAPSHSARVRVSQCEAQRVLFGTYQTVSSLSRSLVVRS